MNLAPSPLMRCTVAAALLAAILLSVVGVSSPAVAQEVSCERVPYNQRIILVCKSTAFDTTSPTPEPTAGPNETDEDSEDSPGDDDSDATTGTTSDGDDAEDTQGRPDRGDRGGRMAGADSGLDDADTDGSSRDGNADGESDADATQADSDDALTNGTGINEADAGQEDAGSITDPSSENAGAGSGPDGRFVAMTRTEEDVTPVVVASAALLALGAVFFMAARRTTRSDPTLD